jgi:hypothetical protein
MSVQYAADASQKFTCPAVTAVAPATTVAVSVIKLPEATEPPDATGTPLELIASVVVVETVGLPFVPDVFTVRL